MSLFLTSEVTIGFLSSSESSYANLAPYWYAYAPVLTSLFVVIIVPLFEEIVFRRLILGTFLDAKKKLWHWIGVLVSSLSFGAFYLSDQVTLELYPFYVVFGLVLGFAYMRTRRLYVPILMHALHNALLMIFMFIL